MAFECSKCGKKFISTESLIQHSNMKHAEVKIRKPSLKKYLIISIIVLILFFLAATFYSSAKKTGKYDDFAKCLTSKGAIIYGNDYCSYTNKQLNFFGKSSTYLNYTKCLDNTALCDEKKILSTPTWEINGRMYSGVQTFEKLSEITGCEIK